jgi:hypothetical protein
MGLRASRSRLLAGAVVLLTCLGVVGAWVWANRPVPGSADLPEVLRDRGRLALLGGSDLSRLASGATTLVPARQLGRVREALAGSDGEALTQALQASKLEGIVVDGREAPPAPEAGASLEARLRAYAHVPGLRGHYLAPAAALYLMHEEVRLDPPMKEALAAVARGILDGKRPPRLGSFPEPLRGIRNVEVMVLLREAGRPRLWRSARGSSIASALLTAAVVARERWQERESAMGGPLARVLPRLEVEVALLEEDGTLGGRGTGFFERAITAVHGVGYERKGSWRYTLPERTRKPAAQAIDELLRDNGLSAEALGRPDVRLYRLVTRPLAASGPGASAAP